MEQNLLYSLSSCLLDRVLRDGRIGAAGKPGSISPGLSKALEVLSTWEKLPSSLPWPQDRGGLDVTRRKSPHPLLAGGRGHHPVPKHSAGIQRTPCCQSFDRKYSSSCCSSCKYQKKTTTRNKTKKTTTTTTKKKSLKSPKSIQTVSGRERSPATRIPFTVTHLGVLIENG